MKHEKLPAGLFLERRKIMNICVYGGASSTIDEKYIKEGERLGFLLASRGHTMIFGGGANGLMGAAARGVTRGEGHCVSIVPSFFNVDGVLYDKSDRTEFTETMRIRKGRMEELSDGFIMTPGGIGTFDEFFEMLTLLTLDRHKKPIAVLNSYGFYDLLFGFLDRCCEKNFVKKNLHDFFFVSDEPEKVLDYIEKFGE